MDDRTRGRSGRARIAALQAALYGSLVFVALARLADAQAVHRWTEIDSRGTAVDWSSLEQQETPTQQLVSLIWARTVEREDTITVHVAVRCGPAHAAIVASQRPRGDGGIAVTGPVPLSALTWQDPPAISYLATVMRAVCSRTRDQRGRPC